ncbi:extensin family protein [Bradyrhizobium sp. SRS-191]|uniref:extensin-like domain-containing protein n=1 Tax=Bradyrhizobium sp. SRS-191 TaxID=2962606 RepID=UPI00211F3464|nr:extensin family protein [Bradyrhizobium sp. SRS-191]
MTRGVRLYLVGSIVLVSLAGCGRGFFQEREPWRAEAEIACLKSGAVRESADIVRIDPISGPGMCGADYPLKVAALGEATASYGFADESLRPPGSIGGQPRWPINKQPPSYPPSTYQPQPAYPSSNAGYPNAASAQPGYGAAPGAPLQLEPPAGEDDVNLPADRSYPAAPYRGQPAPRTAYPQQQEPPPRLGPSRDPVGTTGPVAVKPTATLACPIVSALDRWLAESVQPAAQRWFGQRVVEIKQISAYSCRGMNGNPSAHISEHAFGNALDISAFILSDGRRITVKDGWIGVPEEQGFLRDVQGGACQQFTTVLAPGSNVYHYDHIHVDLMRRASRRLICQPAAQSGETVAARVQQRRYGYGQRDPDVTSSIPARKQPKSIGQLINEEDEFRDY